jgi:hypothetical protein
MGLGGPLDLVTQIAEVVWIYGQVEEFVDHGKEVRQKRIVPSGAASVARISRRAVARTKAFSTTASGTPR